MGRKKTSALPSATTPLAGSELVAVVQGGISKRVPSSELGGSANTSQNVKKTGSTIDTVKGLNGASGQLVDRDGVELDDDEQGPIGAVPVYSEVNGVAGRRLKKPAPPGHFDVEDYGAIPDWGCGRTGTATNGSAVITGVNFTTGLRVGQKIFIQDVPDTYEIQSFTSTTITLTTPVTATSGGAFIVTDNYDAFVATFAAAKAYQANNVINRKARIISDGPYFISQTLHVRVSVVWEGTGAMFHTTFQNVTDGRSYPGTSLVFPKDIDGIWFHSGQSADVGSGGDVAGDSADSSVFGHVNVSCFDPTTTSGHGVRFTTPVYFEHVRSYAFGGNGFQGFGYANANLGNASSFHLFRCIASYCKGHGFYIYGGDANAGVVDSCEAGVNTGVGFYDGSGLGNVYIGCHAEANLGDVDSDATHPGYSTGGPGGTGDGHNHDYRTDAPTNCSTFLGCYSEGGRNAVASPSVVFGGFGMGENGGVERPLGAFAIGAQGVAAGAPLRFVSAYPGTKGVRVTFGTPWSGAADYDNTQILSFSPTDAAGTDQSNTRLLFDSDWWHLQTEGPYKRHFRFPSALATGVVPSMLFEHGVLFGRTNAFSRYDEAASPPQNQVDGATAIDYVVGDFVRNTDNATNPHIFGWICTVAGQVGGAAEFEEIASGTPRTAQTANNTPVDIVIATLAAGDMKQVDVIVTVRDATAAVRQSFKLSALYYGAAGPTATIDGSVTSTAAGTGTAAATLTTNSDDVQLTITGIAMTNLDWSYDVSVIG